MAPLICERSCLLGQHTTESWKPNHRDLRLRFNFCRGCIGSEEQKAVRVRMRLWTLAQSREANRDMKEGRQLAGLEETTSEMRGTKRDKIQERIHRSCLWTISKAMMDASCASVLPHSHLQWHTMLAPMFVAWMPSIGHNAFLRVVLCDVSGCWHEEGGGLSAALMSDCKDGGRMGHWIANMPSLEVSSYCRKLDHWC